MKKKLKSVHIPFSYRNPYQRLLCEALRKNGIDTVGEKRNSIRFIDTSLFKILLKHGRTDIIHFHWHHSFFLVPKSRLKTIAKSIMFLAEAMLIRLLGIKLVWTVHNLTNHEKKQQNIERWFVRLFARISHLIIVHCCWAKREISRNLGIGNGRKVKFIHHGNFQDYYPNTIPKEHARSILGLKPNDLVFLFLGEIRYYKGVFELIENFRLLNDECSELIVAGKPFNEKIAHEVREKTSGSTNISLFLDFIPDKDLQIFINACDIMVFPFREIFTSGSVIMAMSFGKPVIAPSKGCIPETVDEKGAFLYDPSNTKKSGLLEAMQKTLKEHGRLNEMGLYNIKVSEKWAWQYVGKDTVKLYQQLLSSARP